MWRKTHDAMIPQISVEDVFYAVLASGTAVAQLMENHEHHFSLR